MSKKPSRKTIITKLDNVFSQYIRLRYSKNEISECVTCGKQDHWKKLQAGHFVSRKHYSTRWDEDNVQVQCSGCNVFRYGEQYLFSKYLGVDLSEELLIKSRKIQKFTDNELLEMIELYTEKVNNLLI
jgi:5-methylcytosine-specific restriction endonuclease McrA